MLNKIIIGVGLSAFALWLLQRLLSQRIIQLPRQWRLLLAGSLLIAATGAKAKTLPLEKSAEWRKVERAWQDPTDQTIGRALTALDTLEAKGFINKEESGLLGRSLAAKRPRTPPPPHATCYKPMPSPDWSAYNRLNGRLPYLESIVDTTQLNPIVWNKLIIEIKEDLSAMDRGKINGGEENTKKKDETRARVEEIIRRIEKKLESVNHPDSLRAKP